MEKWTTKDGRTIAVKDMSDSHLLNTMKMLERNHSISVIEASRSFPTFQGDMAQYYAEQSWFAIQESSVEEMYPIYADMFDEADRRGLL